MIRRTLRASVMFLFAALATFSARAADLKLETGGTPPEELAPAVRESLAPAGIRVVGPNGPMCEVWLRKTIPAKANAPEDLGIAFTPMAEGTLLGAIRFYVPSPDYRRVRVRPGVYTIRYMIHPMDGNHLGVAPQRDFAILLQAAADTSLDAIAGNDLLTLGRKASGVSHPTVWRIEAMDAGEPSLVHLEEEDHWVLRLEVTLQPEGGAPVKRGMGLVVSGSAPEA